MRHKKRSVLCGVLAMTLAAGIGGLTVDTALAQTFGASGLSYQDEETEPVVLEKVDKSQGVTYIRSESGGITAIHLNGNSVIVQSAKKSEEDTTTYYKIYIDENQNGIVDGGEKAVELPTLDDETVSSEYISSSLPIYGVYNAIAADPVVITCEASTGSTLFGVYKGEAGDVTINNTGNISTIFAVNESTVHGNVVFNNTGAGTGTAFGASSSDVEGNVTVTHKNSSAGYIMAAQSGTVNGDVTLNFLSDADYTGSSGTVYAACGTTVKGKVRLYHHGGVAGNTEYAVFGGTVECTDTNEPAVLVDLQDGISASGVGAVSNATVTSAAPTAVQYAVNNHQLSGSVYVINGSDVTATGSEAVALDMDVLGTSKIQGSFYGVYSGSQTKQITGDVDVNVQLDAMESSNTGEYSIVKGMIQLAGDVRADIKNAYLNAFYGIYGNGKITVNGDLTINMTGCQITGGGYAAMNGLINGDVSMTGDETTCITYHYLLYGSTATGNVTASAYGLDPETSRTSTPSYFYGLNGYVTDAGYSVGKNLDIKLLGGSFSMTQGAYSGGVIKGDMSLSMTGISTSGSSSSYGVYQTEIGGNATITTDENCSMAAGLYCISNATVKGNARVDIQSSYKATSSTSNYFYGVSSSNIEGTLEVTAIGGSWYSVYGVNNGSSNKISGICTVKLSKLACINYFYGIYGGTYEQAVNVTVDSVEKNEVSTYSCYFYGESNATFKSDFDLSISNVKNMTSCYVLNGANIGGNLTADISNMDLTSQFSAVYSNVTCTGDAVITVNDVDAPSWYGLYSTVASGKAITFTATDCNSTSGTYVSLANSTSAPEGIQIDINNCNFVNTGTICFTALKDSVVNVNGGSCSIGNTAINVTGSNNAKVQLNYKGVALSSSSSSSSAMNIANYGSGDMVLEMLIDDACTLPEQYQIIAGTGSCPAMAHVKNDYYFSGAYPVTAQLLEGVDNVYFYACVADLPGFSVKNVSFENCSIALSENETITAQNSFTFKNVTMLLEGTLSGPCSSDALSTVHFYMNGGAITDEAFDEAATKLYPVTLKYDENAMTISHSFASMPLRPKMLFAGTSSVQTIQCTVRSGFQLESGTYQADGDELASNMSASTSGSVTTYSFDMVEKPVTVTINSVGNELIIGKTVADPVAVLNKAYTEEAPLYDFSSLLIYNDGSEGTMGYALAEDAALPEGLSLVNGKLIGTPTVENTEGTPVKFVVTGKNGSTAEVTLNIIVTSDPDTMQTNQDGRVIVDDTAKTINCMGSSVIIDACGEETAVYLDDNRDGVADYAEPAVKGDYALYTLYGLRTFEITKPIQIIMKGGTLKSLYTVYEGTVTTSDCDRSVYLSLQGGAVTYITYGACGSSTVTEGVYVERTGTTVNMLYSHDSNTVYEYSYLDNNNKVAVAGNYTLEKDLTPDSFTVSAGTSSVKCNSVTVKEGVTLTTAALTLSNYTNLYNRGTVNCTGTYKAGNSFSRQYVIGEGKVLPEDNTFNYLFYPITLTYDNLPKGVTAPTLSGVKYEDVQYGSANLTSTLGYYQIKGYTAYYSINDGEEISLGTPSGTAVTANTSKYIYGERKPTNVHVFYVAHEIEAALKFGAPTAIIGKEYTAEDPLYDYTTVKLENDTAGSYGNAPTYVLQHGSSLPSGLSLKDGKVIGTPTGESGLSVPVTVVITGRNGTSAEVPLTYQLVNEAQEEPDINDMISYNGSVLDLNGTSVVIHPAASNANNVNIYLDENHDGVADNNNVFTYKGSSDLNLASATVYGYRDTTKSYDGDISIYAFGGTINYLYGAYGTSASANAVVNGKVSLYMNGANISQYLAAGYYASAEELNLYCTAGQMSKQVRAAYYPGNVRNVHFEFTEGALYYNTASSSSYFMAVTEGGTVTGNVYAVVGGTTNAFSISSSYSNYGRFYGVYMTKVGGNVDYVIQGNWYTYKSNNNFAYQAEIAGDMNVDWRSGTVSVSSGSTLLPTFANACTINNLTINVAENAAMTGTSKMYPYYSGTIQNVYMNVPASVSTTVTTRLAHPYNSTVTYPKQSGYLNLKGALYIMGEYTLNEDFDATSVTVYENASLTVAKGVTLTATGAVNAEGAIVNEGNIEAGSSVSMATDTQLTNTGTMNIKSGLTLNSGAKLDNQGSLTSKGSIENSGIITSSGDWTAEGNIKTTSSIVNSGVWNTKNGVYLNAADATVTNENIWNADGVIYVQTAGARLTNTGEWITEKQVYVNKENAVIENTSSWNMNYSLYVAYGKVDNKGTITGKFNGTGTSYCVYITSNGSIVNTGSWYGDAYLYINKGIFDNSGTMEVNPQPNSATGYNMNINGTSSILVNREGAICKLNACISSSGKIVNYGTLRQTYTGNRYNYLGTIYAAKDVVLSGDISQYKSTTSFYYPAKVEYPDTAVTGATLATVYSSGIEGDENQYLKANAAFTVTLDGYQEGFDEADVKSITYGIDETEASATTTENQWQGTAPFENLVVQVNIAKNDATQIEIAPAEVVIDKLTVNQNNKSIYDLNNLEITGDDGTEGTVTYAVSVSKPLPEGLTLKDGVIFGTPKYASNEPYTAEIIVTGKNLTKATLKLTFRQIEKAVPTLSVPTGIYGYTDYTLAQVRGYSNPSTGTFSWPDSSLVITEKCLAGEKFDLYFTPYDTDNYDWSKLSASSGTWNAELGRVECKVSVRMYTVKPSYTVPADITAVYGQTLEDVKLPSDENGAFVWRDTTASVGTVGKHSYYADYVPKDTGRYSTVTFISIAVTVQPKELTAPIPENLVTYKGNTIGQVALPEVEAGTYKWVTAASTEVEEGKTYKAVFIPDDTTNYTWTIGEGASYSAAYGGYVFDVTIKVVWHEEGKHTYETRYDDTYHWKECLCGEITGKEAHTLSTPTNNGATHVAACSGDGCGYTEEASHTYTKNQDANHHWSECECGDIISRYSHSYTKTVYNDTEHWKECSCGVRKDEEEHTFNLDKSDSTSHWKQCSCGAKTEVTLHSYTTLTYDEDNHWYACSCGAKNSVEAHAYGKWICDEDADMHYAVCDCGSKKTAEHSYGECVSTGTESHKQVCADCGRELTGEHTWDAGVITVTPTYDTEGLKLYTCKACGETREEVLPKNKPPHYFELNLMSYDENEHWIVCDDGDEFEMENSREAHTFSDWKTDDADGHYKECVCGYRVNEGKHVWQLVYDENTHWYECTICGETKGETTHSYTSKSDEVNHWKACSCGKRIDVEQHAYISYKYNANTHWDECSCGKRVNVTSHSYGKWQPDTKTGGHFRTCICGSKETAEHSEEYTWTSAGAGSHTGVCADCGGGTLTEAHTWDEGKVTTSPTTTTTGVKTYTCTKCRETKTETIAKLPESHTHTFGTWSSNDTEHWQLCDCGDEQKRAKHTWNAGTVTQEPTETETGVKVYKCTVCGKEKSEELPKLTHEHTYSEDYTFNETYHWRACGCDAVTDKALHSWNKGQVIVAATVDKTGTMQYTCTVCGAVKLSILPKLEETHVHSFGDWIMSDDLSHTRTCSCGSSETKSHRFGSWTADGANRHKRTCSDCGHVVYEKHAWDAGKITTAATEEAAGVITYTCKVCGGKRTETYTFEDHVHSYGACTPVDEYTHEQTCSGCSDVFISIHVFDAGVITKKPTTTAEGVMTYTCTECGYAKTEPIEKLPESHVHAYGAWERNDGATHKKVCSDCDEVATEAHSWNSGAVTVAASETAEGVMTYTCTVCGETRTEAIAKLPPSEKPVDPPVVNPPADDPSQGQPVGTELTDAGSNAKFTVVNPADIDAEDTDTTPAVVYTGSTKSTAKEITIPDTITVNGVVYRVVSIADGAFKNNKKLTKITIGKNVKTIGNSAFENCKALKTVSFKKTSKVKTIGKKTFYKCTALTKITLPKSVVTIKDSAFDGCKKLATVTFQSGSKLKTLGKKVFNGCVVLKKITIPKNVQSIGASAFNGCKKLATITIQSTKLKTVGKNAF